MKLKFVYSSLIVFALLLVSIGVRGKDHPCLMLTKNGVQDIRKGMEGKSLFNKTLVKTKQEMDAVLTQPIVVPIPKDAGGGYTHERHKKNYEEMQQMGILYQLYQDEKYAAFVKNMLMEYAKMYPTL